jgi:hypothetical protein
MEYSNGDLHVFWRLHVQCCDLAAETCWAKANHLRVSYHPSLPVIRGDFSRTVSVCGDTRKFANGVGQGMGLAACGLGTMAVHATVRGAVMQIEECEFLGGLWGCWQMDIWYCFCSRDLHADRLDVLSAVPTGY